MKKELFSYKALIGLLSVAILLTLTTFVQAQNIEKWTATVSFTLKVTTNAIDTKTGNRRFVTSNETFGGTINLYWGSDPNYRGPVEGPDGCMAELLGSDGTNICFNDIIGTGTLTKKTGKGSSVFVGTGNIATTVQEQEVTGIAYINGKGSMVSDISKNPISISFGGTVGGGYSSLDLTANFVFSGTIPTTPLTK